MPRPCRPPPARVRGALEADGLDQVVWIAWLPIEARVEVEELARPGLRVDPALLEHEPKARAELASLAGRVEAEDRHAPGVGSAVALHDLDGRRLAGAVGPEERDDRSTLDSEVEPVDDGPTRVALEETLDLDGRGRDRHGAMAAYWRAKSSACISPIWIPRRTPFASMKYDCGGATTR